MHWATPILFASHQLVIGKLGIGPVTTLREVPRDGNDRLVAIIVMRKNGDNKVRVPFQSTGLPILFVDL